jgi:hypothetical protein
VTGDHSHRVRLSGPELHGDIHVRLTGCQAALAAFTGSPNEVTIDFRAADKAVVQALLAQGTGIELIAPVAAFIARAGETVGRGPNPLVGPLTREQAFVVSRSLMGVVRAAVLEEQPVLASRAFEDELVRMIVAYLGAVTVAADPDPDRKGQGKAPRSIGAEAHCSRGFSGQG